MTVSQRFLRAAVGGVIAGTVVVSVWAANASINGTMYSCTGGTVAGDGSISYTGCNGGTSTSGTSTSGTSGAANDPGMFTGTWIPEGMTDVWVVDQSETGGVGGTTVIPGCANQKSQLNVCGSSLVETRNGVTTTITMAQGHTMSIRYLSEATVVTGSYFKVSSGTGAGVPAAVQVSLSSQPGDFTGPSTCNKTANSGGNPLIILNGTNCPVAPNTYYYLNIKTTTACSPTNCTFKIAEPASFTN